MQLHEPEPSLRVATWNVNGLPSAIRNGFLDAVRQYEPDVLFLQEVKIDGERARAALEPLRDHYCVSVLSSETAGRAGVAVLTRGSHQVRTLALHHPELDAEGRLLAVDYRGAQYWSCLAPSGFNEVRLALKHEYLRRLLAYAVESGREPVLLGGDLNVAHCALDIETGPPPRCAGFLPEERAVLDGLAAEGWVDLVRAGHAEPGPFTWRSRSRGWRLDHLWASPALRAKVSAVALGPRKPISDHSLLLADVAFAPGASSLRS